jgi:hypothetical protein
MDWVAPSTDADSMRQAKLRAGLKDHSQRIVTGAELDQLLARAQPTVTNPATIYLTSPSVACLM